MGKNITLSKIGLIGVYLLGMAVVVSSDVLDKNSDNTESSGIIFTHKKLFKNTLIFSRVDFILHYNNFCNYNKRCWTDRPLFMDTSLRKLNNNDKSRKSFFSDCRLATMSGLNFAPLFAVSEGNQPRMDKFTSLLNEVDLEGVKASPMVFLPSYKNKGRIDIFRKYIENLLKSKNALRVNGKLLVIVYYADLLNSYDDYKNTIEQLRKEFPGKLLFVSDIVLPGGQGMSYKRLYKSIYQNNGEIQEEYKDKVKKHLRSYLDISDGVVYARPGNSYAINVPTYENRFDKNAFKQIVKLYDDVLSEEKYKNKYLGLGCATGYNNPGIPSIDQECGTKQFRHSMEQSLEADPDFILCTTWDEFNENDIFKPTVLDGLSKMRMLRYYNAKLQNKELKPLAHDNTSIPNIILSHRLITIIGEKLEIEILNVPDNNEKNSFLVQLQLTDIKGNVIKTFPFSKFAQNKMQDKTYFLASEDYKDYEVILPKLIIKDYKGKTIVVDEGLTYIQLRASWNWNYKYCNQPIRDIIKPEVLSFKSTIDKKDNKIYFSGEVKCNELLSSVEILENNFPVWAYDINKVYGHPDKNHVFFVNFEKIASKVVPSTGIYGTVSLKNSDGYIQSALSFNEIIDITPSNKKIITLKNARINPERFYKHGVFVIVPDKDLDKASVSIDINWLKTEIPVKDVVERGVYRDVIKKDIVLRIEDYQKSPDIPVPINQKSVSFFRIKKTPTYYNSIYQLRVIAKDGKIFRSKPVIFDSKNNGQKVDYAVYSETRKKPVNIKISKSRIPDIVYSFAPFYKKLLTANNCRSYNARMGGIEHYDPFLRYLRQNGNEFPASFKTLTPEWVQNNGNWCLKFKDGSFMVFPMDTFPGWKSEILPRGSFTIIFEIMPLSDKPSILLSQQSWRPGALTLYLKNGKLSGKYTNHNNKTFQLKPNLSIPINKWSKVLISYNLEKMLFQVNNQKAELIPVNGRALNFTPFVFGGFIEKNKFYGFNGYLKSLRVIHKSIIPLKK